MLPERELKWYDKHGKTRPDHQAHLRDDQISDSIQKLTPHTWRQEGNKLIGEVADGTRFVQTIPTDRLLSGVDDDGLPTFRKV